MSDDEDNNITYDRSAPKKSTKEAKGPDTASTQDSRRAAPADSKAKLHGSSAAHEQEPAQRSGRNGIPHSRYQQQQAPNPVGERQRTPRQSGGHAPRHHRQARPDYRYGTYPPPLQVVGLPPMPYLGPPFVQHLELPHTWPFTYQLHAQGYPDWLSYQLADLNLQHDLPTWAQNRYSLPFGNAPPLPPWAMMALGERLAREESVHPLMRRRPHLGGSDSSYNSSSSSSSSFRDAPTASHRARGGYRQQNFKQEGSVRQDVLAGESYERTRALLGELAVLLARLEPHLQPEEAKSALRAQIDQIDEWRASQRQQVNVEVQQDDGTAAEGSGELIEETDAGYDGKGKERAI